MRKCDERLRPPRLGGLTRLRLVDSAACRRAAVQTALTLCATIGCAANAGHDAPSLATVRDSAGVQIVENRDPAWTDATRWTIDSTPTLTIGREGDPQLEFYQLNEVRRLDDGRIVAVNSGSDELRYFSPAGAYLCTAGRQGAGPGEFEYLGSAFPIPGDSLIAFSAGGGGRLSFFDPRGAFVRTIVIPRIPDAPDANVDAILANRILLLRSQRGFRAGMTSGIYRDSATIALMVSPDSLHARLGRFPSVEHVLVAGANNQVSVTGSIFGRNTHLAASDTIVYIGTSDRYEIGEYGLDGRLRRSIRVMQPLVPVTPNDIARAESTRMVNAETERQRALWRGFLENMRYPPTFPAFSDLIVDDEGNLWVAHFPRMPGPRTWSVFDPSGQLLGDVEMPPRFYVTEISESELLGFAMDELGVQRAQAYRILKPGRSMAVSPHGAGGDIVPEGQTTTYRACGVEP